MKVTNKTICELITVSLVIISIAACQHQGNLKRQLQSGRFTYLASDQDQSTVREIAALMDSVAPEIARDLDVVYRHAVTVEVYPNQEEFDAHLMNPSMRGTPAISARNRIQLVSPKAPIQVPGIEYRERLWFPVHEFAHLVIDQISEQMPTWLDEGVASYEGSRLFYTQDRRVREILRDRLPTFADLTQSYSKVPAADVFSFSLIEFIVAEYGRPALNRILRAPDRLDQVLKSPLATVEERWHRFIAGRYGSPSK
jgi:hypothetical protein